ISQNNGAAAGSCVRLSRKRGPIAIKGRCTMKTFASANTYLSAALALAAIVAAGTLPASAQSRDHTGSMMPFYYEGTGEQKTGAWARKKKAKTPKKAIAAKRAAAANKAIAANRAAAANKAVAANKAAAANKQAAQTPRSLYLYAGKHAAHHGTRLD